MGHYERKHFEGEITPFVVEEFDASLIPYVWDELKDRFNFNTDHWRVYYQQELNQSSRGESEVAVFIRWGNKTLNPVLNTILGRGSLHPTFNRLLDYLIRKHKSVEIKKKEEQQKFYKNFKRK